NNEGRKNKTLWCAREAGDKITLHRSETGEGECRYIIDTILKDVTSRKNRYGDFAVLYRVNEISRHIETAFAKSGLPYRLLGGMRFYDRKEIKDILAYLYLIHNTGDDERLLRIVNEPKRKIGDKTLETVSEIASEQGLSLFDVMKKADKYPALEKAAPKLQEFTALIEDLRRQVLLPSRFIPLVMEKTGYLAMLEAGGEKMKGDIDNLKELISGAVEYEARAEEATLSGFLEESALLTDVDKYNEEEDAVTLMTIHSAKGLEFPIVFIAGAEEGIFPGTQSLYNPTELAEERRLAYVAITRAKEKLFVTYASERLLYGMPQHHRLSRFFGQELPKDLVFCEDSFLSRSAFVPDRPKAPQISEEFTRRASVAHASPGSKSKTAVFAVGARVRHSVFGDGVVLSVKSLGGDTLYEVAFDSGSTKKLMASYAKLTLLP
ncbi:MAG: ATP-binding domain-containing protein, partial [Clostridia bacterium]|nr:ATP-binding domain-containing protein [Clostridia bacterium]